MSMENFQHTIARSVTCEDIGLHSGAPVRITLRPAHAGEGITFLRTDLSPRAAIPARYDHVTATRLGTVLENKDGVSISTVEHLMAALWGCGIDNVTVEVEGPEIPILDGSSAPFVRLIQDAGITCQWLPRRFIRVKEPITVAEGEAWLKLLPAQDFTIHCRIRFDHPVIDAQEGRFRAEQDSFNALFSHARTFGFTHEVEALRKAGLARGGSLDNAVVLDETKVLNEEGLRSPDEFVRHKILDCVGDLYLAGVPLLAQVEAFCTGHRLNNLALRALFAHPGNWEFCTGDMDTPLSNTEPAPSVRWQKEPALSC